jgi:hypothetical protein
VLTRAVVHRSTSYPHFPVLKQERQGDSVRPVCDARTVTGPSSYADPGSLAVDQC